ncbi:MAG: CoA ester lyase [Proteobacteria bacterium]|nr:CoA ester lyase [Pseudomonadota bacterium]MDA1357622.1 CoA ester lyase [Pseudomonadota bacterium]
MEPMRTWLFAPGNHPRKVEKVFTVGADAVVLDLEDAVAVEQKTVTRATVVEALKARPKRASRGYIRVNAIDTEFCYGDLKEVIGPWLDGILLPKVESAGQLQTIDWLLAQLESACGMAVGGLDILPIIETGRGVTAIDEIARSGTRVRRLSFGAGDFTNDMGMVWTADESELIYARSAIALASRAAGLEAPIDTVFIDLQDDEHLEKSARTALSLGYRGKLCIHPAQIEPVNAVFTPSAKEVARARKHVEAFATAEAEGSASIQVDGYFVDYPIVEKARRTLALMAAIDAKGR